MSCKDIRIVTFDQNNLNNSKLNYVRNYFPSSLRKHSLMNLDFWQNVLRSKNGKGC